MPPTNLISVQELKTSINDPNLVVLDCSWYLPNQKRNAFSEYLHTHIPRAQFFDIDNVSDQNSDLPHMLPSPDEFEQHASQLGIDPNKKVVVYDGSGVFSAARVWWMLRVFGHQQVNVLNGGLPAWLSSKGKTVSAREQAVTAKFKASFSAHSVIAYDELRSLIELNQTRILDARPTARFEGLAPEPRAGLASGHMPNSLSLPYDQLLTNGHLKSRDELIQLFASYGVANGDDVVTTCGSGVTAAIITLALDEAGFGLQRLYDGAWVEWASSIDSVILSATG